MSQASVVQAVDVLTPGSGTQVKLDHGFLVSKFEWLRVEAKRACLSRDLQHLGVNICCIQETYIIASNCDGVLPKRFCLFTAHFDSWSRGVSWLVSHFLDTT